MKKEKRFHGREPSRQLPDVILFPQDELILESGQLFQIGFGLPGKNCLGNDLREFMYGNGNQIISISQESAQVNNGKGQGSIFGNDKIINFSNFLVGVVIDSCFIEFRYAPARGNEAGLSRSGCKSTVSGCIRSALVYRRWPGPTS